MTRLAHRLRRLAADRRGAATIEFALWSGLFFMSMLVAMDFALWRTQQLRLGSAIEQGGVLAFTNRVTLESSVAQSIQSYVRTAATVSGSAVPEVTVNCNGGACPAPAERVCRCLSTDAAGTNSFGASPVACGSPCTGGATAGYYFSIRVSRPYQSAILPHAMLTGKAMVESVMVRLQ